VTPQPPVPRVKFLAHDVGPLYSDVICDIVPIWECKLGHVYLLRSRNLTLGAFDGGSDFIGIREKFGHKFLFPEVHYDACSNYGTAVPLEEVGRVSRDIALDTIGDNDALFSFLETLEKGLEPQQLKKALQPANL